MVVGDCLSRAGGNRIRVPNFRILTHPTTKLYDGNTVHLLCSNYWLQSIYQELLHSLSRYNATVNGEKTLQWIHALQVQYNRCSPVAEQREQDGHPVSFLL